MADTEVKSDTTVPVIAVTAAVGAVILLFTLLCSVVKKSRQQIEDDEVTPKPAVRQTSSKGGANKKSKQKATRQPIYAAFSHQWLQSTLKGHGGSVQDMAFSPNCKYLVSVADDCTILLWNVKEFGQKNQKFQRTNSEYDYATKVKFSPDSKALLMSMYKNGALRVYRIGKKDDKKGGNVINFTLATEFEQSSEEDVIDIGVATNGRFIMACYADTTMKLWTIKGQQLAVVDTRQVRNYQGSISPCGRFIASCGFTPDVKVWDVGFDKNGHFKSVERAFELKGHKAAVYSFSFNYDSSRMVSLSKDNTWMFWDTKIRYELQEDAHLLQTGKFNCPDVGRIVLSPDARVIAIALGSNVTMVNLITSKQEQILEDLHSEDISCISFDETGKYLVTCGDRHIQVIHNVPGYQATIKELLDKEKVAGTQGAKERIRTQIQQAKSALKGILSTSNGSTKS